MAESADKLDVLKASVVEIARQHWDKTGKALLLASLGQTLRRRGHDLKAELRGQKMVPFLLLELNDKVKVLISPFDKLVRGIVPADAQTGEDVKALFTREPSDQSDKGVRIDRRVWLAFSRPMTPGCTRVFFWDPETNFQDIPKGSTIDAGKHPIPEELIIPIGAMPSDERNAKLQQNIRTWFDEHGIDIELAKAKPLDTRQAHFDHNAALFLLFESLDERELARISMPLDIVKKLLGKKN